LSTTACFAIVTLWYKLISHYKGEFSTVVAACVVACIVACCNQTNHSLVSTLAIIDTAWLLSAVLLFSFCFDLVLE
jgi:hypothetical protein